MSFGALLTREDIMSGGPEPIWFNDEEQPFPERTPDHLRGRPHGRTHAVQQRINPGAISHAQLLLQYLIAIEPARRGVSATDESC